MSWGLLNVAMLAGLAGVAIPVLIHFLSRRRDPIVDWGAMQFLELSPRQRRRLNLSDMLLLLTRMLMIAAVAVALARPFWSPRGDAAAGGGGAGRRDVVVVIDGSSSMSRRIGRETALEKAVAWARGFVKKLGAGDSVAILIARDRVKPLVDPPTFDPAKADAALAAEIKPRGASDLAGAVAEALRLLEGTHHPNREIVILTDDQRSSWRPGETERWNLLRELRRRAEHPPRIWAVSFGGDGTPTTGANGSVTVPRLPRGTIVPGRPLNLTSELANAGPEPLTRSVELLIDGKVEPSAARVVGPIPPGGRTSLNFSVPLESAGDHLITVRLAPGDDPIPGDDEASRAVHVSEALPVLLVDGEPGAEILGGEVAYLRAALAPNGDDTRVVTSRVVEARRFDAEALKGRRVAVLANVDRLSAETVAALEGFTAAGGGLFIAPGDRTDATAWNDAVGRLLPARIGPTKGDAAAKTAVARPAPASFNGPALEPLAGDSAVLGEAGFFAYRVLEPVAGSSVTARLDTGEPWLVERPFGKGRVLIAATPFDAEAGTLPVNPDFVPLVHELVASLGEGGDPARNVKPGESVVFTLPADAASVPNLPLHRPDGTVATLPVERAGAASVARLVDTVEPGVYRLDLPSGGALYAAVESDPRESDPKPLEPAEARILANGWPLVFAETPENAADLVLSAERSRKHEVWRTLILVAMGLICGEIWLTRRTARARGVG